MKGQVTQIIVSGHVEQERIKPATDWEAGIAFQNGLEESRM